MEFFKRLLSNLKKPSISNTAVSSGNGNNSLYDYYYYFNYRPASQSEWVFIGIICVLSVAMTVLWVEYRRLKNRRAAVAAGRKRTLSDVLTSESVEVKEHLQEALREVAEFMVPTRGQRFRKRDRMAFHGKRFMRKVSDNMAKVGNDPLLIPKKFIKYAAGEDDNADSDYDVHYGHASGPGPAEEYLDEEELSERGSDSAKKWITPELSHLLNSFHMFGHMFDKAVFLELCKSIVAVPVPSGQYLFRAGDPDDCIYVVQSGRVNVHISDSENRTTTIKACGPGETVSSLLSFVDVLTGHDSVYRTVCCRAVEDSVVIKLPAAAFKDVFGKNPEMQIRVIQLIMARVQRVIFVALHQYLGLTSELVRQGSDYVAVSNAAGSASVAFSSQESLGDALDAIDGVGHDSLMNRAVSGFQAELDIDNADFLRDRIEIRTLRSDDVIMTEDSHNDAGLVFILSGSLVMSQRNENEGTDERVLYAAFAGECVGQLAMLTGEANFYSCKAQEFSRIAILTRDTFFEIVCETPEMVLALAHNVVGRLSPLVRQVDFALDWINMESGKSLFRQGDATDGTFIVLSGRLRSSISGAGAGSKKELVDEYIHGNMVGLVDVVTGTNRLTTVMAVRDSELCKIPANLLNLLKQRYPVVVSKLISLLGHRLLGTFAGGGHGGLGRTNPKSKISDNNSFQSSYTTVALYAASPDVPLTAFAMELAHALSVCGQIKRISSDLIYDKFGANAFESGRDFRLNAWLAMVEHRHKVVLYQCDPEMTKWTSRCLRHADVIFDIVRADRETQEVTRAERQLEMEAKRVRKELILLHDEDTERPRGTREWLKRRTWISSHFHVKTAKKLFSRRSQSKIIDYYDRVMLEQVPNIHSDYSRLGRHITGASVGLVMGGGGARGAAHIGMLKAIQEAGIPVDRLGGVSIGAFMGGLWGSSRDMTMVTQKARNYFEGLANHLMAPVFDFTYPITSLMSGRYFNGTLMEVFGTELEIEDLWLPFFCCSTDITLSQERVHTKGSFWRYCRASMSYAWFLPPLCDPVDGHLLMDGCYVNNVPGDVMAGQGCKYILAIDVTAIDDRVLYNYGDYLSGWWVLWNKINPFATPLKIPPQSEIQLRLAFCSHYKNLEELKSNPNYEYIHPPIAKYSSGQFNLFDEIREVGYHHGNTFFTGLRRAGQSSPADVKHHEGHRHPAAFSSSSSSSSASRRPLDVSSSPPWFPAGPEQKMRWATQRRGRRDSVGYTFTDLAEIVCKNIKDGNEGLGPLPRSRAGSSAAASVSGGSSSASRLRVNSRMARRDKRSGGDGRMSTPDRRAGGGGGGRISTADQRAAAAVNVFNRQHQHHSGSDSDDTGIAM